MRNLILVVSILTVLSACKKKTMVIIQARDYITGDGSAYANQAYSVIEKWTPLFEVKTNQVANGILDENGYASLELKLKDNRQYVLWVNNPEGICYGGLAQYPIKHDKVNDIEFDFLKCGFINFHAENINCEGDEDEFRFRYFYKDDKSIYYYNGFTEGSNYDWQKEVFIGGCHSYFGDFSDSRPVGEYIIEWQVVRQSGTTEGSGTFELTENNTTTYLIEY